jgi:hypothetical protein
VTSETLELLPHASGLAWLFFAWLAQILMLIKVSDFKHL